MACARGTPIRGSKQLIIQGASAALEQRPQSRIDPVSTRGTRARILHSLLLPSPHPAVCNGSPTCGCRRSVDDLALDGARGRVGRDLEGLDGVVEREAVLPWKRRGRERQRAGPRNRTLIGEKTDRHERLEVDQAGCDETNGLGVLQDRRRGSEVVSCRSAESRARDGRPSTHLIAVPAEERCGGGTTVSAGRHRASEGHAAAPGRTCTGARRRSRTRSGAVGVSGLEVQQRSQDSIKSFRTHHERHLLDLAADAAE